MSAASLHRLSAWAILALVLTVAWGLIVVPFRNHTSAAGETLRQERALLERVRSIAERADQASDLESRASEVEGSAVFLQGGTDAIKTASLQSLIGELAERSGIRLRSARALQPREIEGARLIGVQVQLVCDTEHLQSLLVAIEDSVPLLIVEQVQIVNSPGRGGGKRVGMLEVRLDVYGGARQERKS